MSPTAKRSRVPSSKEQEQAAAMALNELRQRITELNLIGTMNIIWLARWYEKWQLVAGPRKMGRILLALARGEVKEVPHE